MGRVSFNRDNIFSEIAGSPNGVGYDVSLTKVYDDIRDAMFEEDHTISRGVWERELKKADWPLVEKLTYTALVEKSKDLQILGWLMEALVVLDEIEGVVNGIEILTGFVKMFWEAGYPKTEDMESDEEQKFRILEWIYDTVARLSKFIPFTSVGGNKIDICQYDRAIELHNSVAKAGLSASRVLERAQKDGVKTIEEISSIINNMDDAEIKELGSSISRVNCVVTEFKDVVATVSGSSTCSAFSGLLETMRKIENMVASGRKRGNKTDEALEIVSQPVEGIPDQVVLDSRDTIYDKIDAIAKRLAIIEKHSPSPYILNLVVSWKNKSLLEIMDDLKAGNTEAHRLLKSLMS
ncbi:MAG: type VI secretion system ImpA family N-terminal domain-containing protein [Holosporales bacterium]|jgi:type VI secretion system protein ImpA|nr:type VI secretion system ImpA family N-terminal domain-containing protein [Holosporales bacterium]